MAGLIPFNRSGGNSLRSSAVFDDFHNMLDDFFGGGMPQGRSLLRDTFKIDILETESEYNIEAELPGVSKDEIDLSIDDENLCISVNHLEETNQDGKNYIHRERRASTMSRRIRLAGAKLSDIKAKLDNGILTVSIPKDEKSGSPRKINIE